MSQVLQGEAEEQADVGVVERVVDHPASSAVADDPGCPQKSQRVGHRGLRDPDRLGEVAHAELTCLEQGVQEPRARRVGEELELVGHPLGLAVGQESGTNRADSLGIDKPRRARIQSDHIGPIRFDRHLHRCSSIEVSPRCQARKVPIATGSFKWPPRLGHLKGVSQMSIAPTPAAQAADEDVRPDGPTWLRADALCLAGFASLCAGAIHAAAIGAHSDHDQAVLAFTIAAAFQLVWGALAIARSSRTLAVIGAVGNLALVGGWVVAKRSGIGFVDGLGAREPVELGDGLAAGMASLVVVLCLYTVLRPHAEALLTQRIAVTGACVAVALLALPGMTSAARPNHQQTDAAGATADHHASDQGGGAGAETASAVAPVPYDPAKPIDLGGVSGVTPEEQARAENLIAGTLTHLPDYAEPAAAEAAGFRSIRDGATGYEHYINSEYRADGRVLDPDRPESLVYQVRGGQKELVAAMYMAEPGTTLDTTPPLGGALTQWHIHDNLCFTPEGQVAGLTDADGGCSPTLVKIDPVPMIHVWIVPHPCGPFSALEGIAGGSIKPGEERLCDTAHGGH